MANNQPQEGGGSGGGLGDEFFEQILSVGGYNPTVTDPTGGTGVGFVGPSDGSLLGLGPAHDGFNVGLGGFGPAMGLGLNLDPVTGGGVGGPSSRSSIGGGGLGVGLDCGPSHPSSSRINEHESMHLTNLFPAFGQMQPQPMRPMPSSIQVHQAFQSQAGPPHPPMVSQPPAIRPRVRARRGQATDPHSIAERLRRERIAERMKALQELVPSCNKTDRAAMLDEIVDYVKFLRLQVKVLSMSRLGGASAVAQLVADVPSSSVEGDGTEGAELAWEKWSNDGTEEHVAKLMEQDIGAAMQFLQSKALCIMPISLASAIFRSQPPPPSDPPATIKPEMNPPS